MMTVVLRAIGAAAAAVYIVIGEHRGTMRRMGKTTLEANVSKDRNDMFFFPLSFSPLLDPAERKL